MTVMERLEGDIRRRGGYEVFSGIAGAEQMAKKLKGGQWFDSSITRSKTQTGRY